MSEKDAGAAAGGDQGAAAAAAGADAGAAAAATGAAQAGDKGAQGTLAAGGGSAADAGKGGADTQAAAATDWRDQFAGGDKDFRARLDRFTDPAALSKSYRALEQKLSSGEYKRVSPFPEKGTADEQTAWRKEQGIPAKPEEYGDIKLPNGVVPSDADKPVIELFTQFAHKNNWTPAERNNVLGFYYEVVDAQEGLKADRDNAFQKSTEDALRAEWQQDYRRNLNAAVSFNQSLPEEIRDKLLAGRLADGTRIGDHPSWLKWAAQMALDLDPAATIVPAGTANPGKTVEAELESIRAFRRKDPDGYDADKKMQARELELLEAQEKMSRGRQAA